MNFSEKIITWYLKNKRDLPWRNTKDPYKIWLSEVILQQTRVDQGMSYYLKFAEEFPTISSLANAKEEKILKLWQGLGYYSRARNMHVTAIIIKDQFNGKFPKKHEDILALKGIGEYTAAAIGSFAYNQPYPVVDGNVFRVLSRVFGIKTPIDTSAAKKEFYELAGHLMDKKNPALFNQSIMEFGAMHCKPVSPNCSDCVLQTMCVAFEKKQVAILPIKNKKLKQRNRYFNYLILTHKNTLIVNKRIQNDIWRNLYDFPNIETSVELTDLTADKTWQKLIKKRKYTLISKSETYKHILSHQKIMATFWKIELEKPLGKVSNNNFIETTKNNFQKLAIPRLIENYWKKEFS